MTWVPTGALAPRDEPGVELHTKGRTATDGGDWHSAEKHAWAASAEGRAMDARGPAMRGMRQAPRTLLGGPSVAASTQSDQRRSAGTHSHELATKDHTWRTHPTRSALDAPLPGEAAPTALHEHAPPSHCGYLFASSPTSSRNPQILARDRSDCARGQDCRGLDTLLM